MCFSTLGCTEKSIDEVLETAKRFNIGGIEVRGLGGIMENSDIPEFSDTLADKTLDVIKQSRITPVSLNTSCTFHNAENKISAIKEGKQTIDLACRFGFKYIRVFGDKLAANPISSVQLVNEGISELCTYAENKKVDILLETHGDFNSFKSLAPVLDFLKPSPNFGLIWDVKHTFDYDLKFNTDWRSTYDLILPFIRHVHIKDFSLSENLHKAVGEGDVPIKKYVKSLLSDGYDGFFSLEWEKKWHPELGDFETALSGFCDYMRNI